ncbi:Cyclic di-GMP phosphodiesterase response regulator RpfG [Phycisphaerae bacterium RAS1]|nr:Cyclic di-GMP phosphodiesterase response regulator RpfG [Phycisphaerae bacterium RAS1]
MRGGEIQVELPAAVADFALSGGLNTALHGLAALRGAALRLTPSTPHAVSGDRTLSELSLHSQGRPAGRIRCCGPGEIRDAAQVIAGVLNHAIDREEAVDNLSEALLGTYEELNLLYGLLPELAQSIHPPQIAQLLVDETARVVQCRRVSLLVADEDRRCMRVVASRGLPVEARDVTIPIGTDGPAGPVMSDSPLVFGENAVPLAHVPLTARGQTLGVLVATERIDAGDFTARDLQLLQGLASVSASAIHNCRLHEAMKRQMLSTIRALARAVDARDHYTHDHSARVARLCVSTARRLGVGDDDALQKIELAGILHDIGKIGIPDTILAGCERLTAAQYELVKQHVNIGAEIVSHVAELTDVARAILHHHERFDGRGYPAGLSGADIPLASRLISVADAYDSLTSDRTYRKACSQEDGLLELRRGSGTQFDPQVVEALAREIGP